MTIEEKAQRYDEVVERAKTEKEKSRNLGLLEFIDENFPELNESEDEKMRKWLIQTITFVLEDGRVFHNKVINEAKDAIAWLEKQGRHKKFIDAIQIGDKVTRNKNEVLVNLSQLERVAKHTDEVEPKFHKGEWIICCDYEPVQIISITGNIYEMSNGDNRPFNIVDNNYNIRLWTIKDAKDGDILTDDVGIIVFRKIGNSKYADVVDYHCVCVAKSERFEIQTGIKYWGNTKYTQLHPATKEQRDTLIKAMNDAGYTFDFKKKELKKIEQKPATWSEDDEYLLGEAIQRIEELIRIAKYCGIDIQPYQRDIDWVKSLKDRYTWKPSEEQMTALNAINVTGGISYAGQGQTLIELYEQLKKLKE